MWTIADVSFEIVGDMTDDPVVTIAVATPAGVLRFTAEPFQQGNTLVLQGVHVQDAGPNAIGTGN